MSRSVVIEVTRGPLVESRHEGIAAVVKPDGSVVASWGDIDSLILPRSANKPIQAMAFVESGAVERFGLGDEHVALACASHSGEKRHVETVRAWLAKVGLSEADLECGTHAPRLQGIIEELAREGRAPTPAFNNCSGKHSGFLTTAVHYGEPTRDYIKYNHPVQRRLREVMTDLCGTDANSFPYGTDGCGIPTLATPLKSLARAMASMAEPSRLSNKHAEAAGRIRAAISAEPFMMAGTGRFCTRINAALPGVAQIKTGAEGVFCGMLPTLGLGVAIKMWDGAARAAEVAMASLLGHLGVLPADQREEGRHGVEPLTIRALEVRLAAPGAGAGAGGVDEYAVVGAGGFADDADVREPSALGAVGQLVENFHPDVGGVDVAGQAEQAGELERLAAGPGAGVEPAAAGNDWGEGENHLRAEIQDLDEAAAVGVGVGDLGVRGQAEGVGEIG